MKEHLLDIYRRLLDFYGPQHWWPGDGAPFVVIVGAILTQSAAWRNVEQALDRLRAAAALSPDAILALPEDELASLIRPSGYFRMKARKLRAFATMLRERFDGDPARLLALDIDELRTALLDTYGIGPETADDIVLYAAHKPGFIVDAYTRRIFDRLGIRPAVDSYDAWRRLFMDALPADVALFNEYHALIVRHGKLTCRKTPLCPVCPLLSICPTGLSREPSASITL